MESNTNYLESVKKQFNQYKAFAEKAMGQLKDEQLFYTSNENSNSIALIIKHMHGNMISRWTDFLTTDGEKPWRKRDEEFEDENENRGSIMKLWDEGWACFFNALNPLKDDQLGIIITIRGESLTVMDAINRQLAHYAYHVGQIVFAAKQLKEGEWNTLTIPKRKKS